MKRVSISRKKGPKTLHVETDLGIVNIRVGLSDNKGRIVEHIEILPDKHAGEKKVLRRRGIGGIGGTRLIQCKKARN